MSKLCFIIENELADYRPMFEKFCLPPLTMRKGTDLCVQCRPNNWFYYLLEGTTRIYMNTYEGNERFLGFMKQDTIQGMGCIEPGAKSVISISAITDVQVLPFTSAILREMMAQDSDFAYQLLLYYSKILRTITYSSGCLGINNLHARLANFLFAFLETEDYRKTGRINMTQEEISAMINLSRAQVAKMLGQFRRENIILTGNRYLTVTDPDKLKEYCQL